MERKLLITHTDLDALGVLVVEKFFNLNFDRIWTINYNEYEGQDNTFPYHILKDFKEIWYADMSPDQKSLDIIKEESIECKVFDHHESQYEMLSQAKHIDYYFDNDKSGTKLFYEFCKENCRVRVVKSLAEFVTLVDTRDLWKEDDPLFDMATDLNRVFYKSLTYWESGYKKFEKYVNYLHKRILYKTDQFAFSRQEQEKIDKDRAEEDKLFKSSRKKMAVREDERGNKFGIVMLPKKISMIAHRILKERKDFSYLIIINTYEESKPKLSLRSKGFNLLQLEGAKGHEQACGHETKDLQFIKDLWHNKIKSIPYAKEIEVESA